MTLEDGREELMTGRTSRRRGAFLEDALLDAAWEELLESGYPSFTLEAVALRAGTSRPVIFRRWPSRTQLAVAAFVRDIARHPLIVPDIDDLRAELLLLLRGFSERARPDLISLTFELQRDLDKINTNLVELRNTARRQFAGPDQLELILSRAVLRGEVDNTRLSPRISSLLIDLARHEVLMTFKPLTEKAMSEIIDEVFLPLIRSKSF